eukprot:447977-Pleurochrysis_carterae.AAC.4
MSLPDASQFMHRRLHAGAIRLRSLSSIIPLMRLPRWPTGPTTGVRLARKQTPLGTPYTAHRYKP